MKAFIALLEDGAGYKAVDGYTLFEKEIERIREIVLEKTGVKLKDLYNGEDRYNGFVENDVCGMDPIAGHSTQILHNYRCLETIVSDDAYSKDILSELIEFINSDTSNRGLPHEEGYANIVSLLKADVEEEVKKEALEIMRNEGYSRYPGFPNGPVSKATVSYYTKLAKATLYIKSLGITDSIRNIDNAEEILKAKELSEKHNTSFKFSTVEGYYNTKGKKVVRWHRIYKKLAVLNHVEEISVGSSVLRAMIKYRHEAPIKYKGKNLYPISDMSGGVYIKVREYAVLRKALSEDCGTGEITVTGHFTIVKLAHGD